MTLGSYTAGKLIDFCKSGLKHYVDDLITPLQWLNMLNFAILEIHELGGWKDTSEFKKYATLNKDWYNGFPFNTKVIVVDIGTSFTDYKTIDRINIILSDTGKPAIEKLESDFWSICNPDNYNTNYANEIIWYRSGDNILMASDVIPIEENFVMFYNRFPALFETNDDVIDLKDTNMKLVTDIVKIMAYQTINTPIPQELKSAENRLEKLRQIADTERANLSKVHNTHIS